MWPFDWFARVFGMDGPKDPTELHEEVIAEAVKKLKRVKSIEIEIQSLRTKVTRAKAEKRGTSQVEATINKLRDQKRGIERELLVIQPDLLVSAQQRAGYEMLKRTG